MGDVSRRISETLKNVSVKNSPLSTLSQKGDSNFVERFLGENIQLGDEEKETVQSQLYIASFWGFHDTVKTLVENGADVNHQNDNTLWTPLHAATYQEHGKVIMYLLNKNADPYSEDFQGRTPVDFASVSDKVWALYAASACEKTSKSVLIEKQLLKRPTGEEMKTYPSTQDNEKKSHVRINYDERTSTITSNDNRTIHAALVDGDVLAADHMNVADANAGGDQPTFNMWRT